jgi:hypothetical protein
MTRMSLLACALVLTGCPKDDAPKADASAPSTSSSISPQASAAASTSASTTGAKATGGAAKYEGKYTATAGALYIPSDNKDYTGVKQAKDEGTKMVGDGTLTLDLDGEGRLTGAFESGPAESSLIDGTVADGNVAGTVRVKNAREDGLHGSLVGKIAGDTIEGTMKLADSNASVLRDVKFTVTKKK